ncbi:hypothetical protein A1F99_088570 [Pyrenophora tritici-repentis]|nr:hypothetical protein A1F99_088570 [Pyrenophora tritici-repentis]KAI1539858.1 hypothetical protein PtrSN001A_004405 [Pyrenophora tritici-repentis]PWO28922.1 hypothetical protein PtrARCrB10_02499 [Pyrenophora tritici-repentis]
MSSLARLAPGQTLAGARWDYRIVNAIKGDNSHQSTVYKAEVHPRTDVSDSPNGPCVVTPLWTVKADSATKDSNQNSFF